MKTLITLIGAVLLCGCNSKELEQIATLEAEKQKLADDVALREKVIQVLNGELADAKTSISNLTARSEIVSARLNMREQELAKALAPKEEAVILPAMAKEGTPVDKVINVRGNVVAENVTFSRVFAGKVIFRKEGSPPVSFYVDSLHPELLQNLGIDAAAVKRAEADLMQQRQEANQKAAEALAVRREQEKLADAVYFANEEAKRKQAKIEAEKAAEKAHERSLDERRVAVQERANEIDAARAAAYIRAMNRP
jgi:hypothetical protein